MSSTGPSIRAVCRILNQNSCGSGSVCGRSPEGGSYVLTNAHVAGTKIGRRVVVEAESLGRKRFEGTVIRAAYSDTVSADWALLHVPDLNEIEPVPLTRELPARGESMYTKGFPSCQPHAGTDIEQYQTRSNGVLLWLPNAIGGQSGSGVYGDHDGKQKALLTWSMSGGGSRWYGAGQLTNAIWSQNRAIVLTGELVGAPRMAGFEYRELLPDDLELDFDRDGLDDPEVNVGVFSEPIQRGIQDYPIWDHLISPEPAPEPAPERPEGSNHKEYLKSLTRIQERVEEEIQLFLEGNSDITNEPPKDDGDGCLDFGL